MSHRVRVGGGRIGVPRDTYQQYLAGVGAVALTEIDGEAHLLPLRGPVAGGRLVKQRNLHGDRVIDAADFLAEYGVGEFTADREFNVRWITEAGALRIEGLRRN
jgi:hypothetical protein